MPHLDSLKIYLTVWGIRDNLGELKMGSWVKRETLSWASSHQIRNWASRKHRDNTEENKSAHTHKPSRFSRNAGSHRVTHWTSVKDSAIHPHTHAHRHTQTHTHTHTHTLTLRYSVKHLATVLPGSLTSAWLPMVFAKLLNCPLSTCKYRIHGHHIMCIPTSASVIFYVNQQWGTYVVMLPTTVRLKSCIISERHIHYQLQYPGLTSSLSLTGHLLWCSCSCHNGWGETFCWDREISRALRPVPSLYHKKKMPGEPQLWMLDLKVKPEGSHDTAATSIFPLGSTFGCYSKQ